MPSSFAHQFPISNLNPSASGIVDVGGELLSKPGTKVRVEIDASNLHIKRWLKSYKHEFLGYGSLREANANQRRESYRLSMSQAERHTFFGGVLPFERCFFLRIRWLG
jgi:hypothetical protein